VSTDAPAAITLDTPGAGGDPLPSPVILAGGKGTRLAPFTSVLPKPLMPLGDRPILDVLLQQLRAQGWGEATLAVGHMASLIRAYCGLGERYDMDLHYVEESSPLGTVGPLAYLPEETRAGRLIVMNGDLLTTLRFRKLVRAHADSGAVLTIAVQRRPIKVEFGVLDLAGDLGGARQIVSYREKPEIESTVSMGVYVFEPEALDYITPGEPLDIPELIQRLLADGRTVAGYPFEGYWLDIGRHSDYQMALDDFERIRDELLAPAEVEA
jgi:NDP-sugar pyrophosphorylase family protein